MIYSEQQILSKMQKYCTYQERCHKDVRYKLISLKVYGDQLDHIISKLIQEDYLNEQRYAEHFSSGKFRINNWGKIKITNQLKLKNISQYCINKGLKQIPEEEYRSKAHQLIEKYIKTKKIGKPLSINDKKRIFSFMIQKGYESMLINHFISVINDR